MKIGWEHCVAGVSGGALSTLVLHPLDLVKVRFQVNEGTSTLPSSRPKYNGIIDALYTIGKTGGVRGLYQGVTPNLLGTGASWGLYFMFYNALKQRLLDKQHVTTLAAHQHMVAAAEAGVLTLVLTNPIWVAKTRLCLQYDALPSKRLPTTDPNYYRGVVDCLMKVYRLEGIAGLYKGFIPGIMGTSHGALQFMAYEEFKKRYNRYKKRPLDAKHGPLEYIVFSALSKIFAASGTYPYQVVRARLQDQHRSYNGVMDCINQTWKNEGIRGFYKGVAPYMMHVIPNICIVFLMYEYVTSILKREYKDSESRDESQLIKAKLELNCTPNIDQIPVVPIRLERTTSKDGTNVSNTSQTVLKNVGDKFR